MSYCNCDGGLTYTDWKLAGWCQIYMELTENKSYALHEHYIPRQYTLLERLFYREPDNPESRDPDYYTVDLIENCKEGAEFDKDNYTEAIQCKDSLTRLKRECYEARIRTPWWRPAYYTIVRTGLPPEPLSFCEFYVERAKVDAELCRRPY